MDLFNHSETSIRNFLTKYMYNRNRTHYMKWIINAEWSIRFIFVYDNKPKHKMSYVLKSHYTKDYITLTKNEAIEYIQKYCDKIEPQEFFSLTEFGKGYRRIILDPIYGTDCFIENRKKF